MDIETLKRKINSVNWSFDFNVSYNKGIIPPFNCRKYYSYPATFVPEIPYTLIDILSKKGDTVLDPFGGIGTTFLQALSLERVPYSFDINPIASMVCEALYKLFSPSFPRESVRKALAALGDNYDASINYEHLLVENRRNLGDWYEQETMNELSYLINAYDSIQDGNQKTVLGLVLPSILATMSSQNKGWAYIADNVKPKSDELRKKNAFDYFRNATKLVLSDVENHLSKLSSSYGNHYEMTTMHQHIFTASIEDSNLRNDTIDLIVTSPPYPRMIDYVKSQRLSYYFSNLSYQDHMQNETGARFRRSRKDALGCYQEQMLTINKKMLDVTKSGGFICLVLPDYSSEDDRGEVIDKVAKWYIDNGTTEVSKISRYIPSNKRTLNIQWASLVNEQIHIFQKG